MKARWRIKQRANKLQYAYVTEKSDTSNTAVATRPLVKARLKDGTAVEGLLMRFADGTYVVKLGDSLRSFQESEIASISFSGPRASGRATERERTPGVRPVRGDMSDEFARLGVDSVQQAVKLLERQRSASPLPGGDGNRPLGGRGRHHHPVRIG